MRPQPCVQWKKAHKLVTTVTPEAPGIPRAMALRLIPRSSRRSGFLVTVVGAMRKHCRQLDVSVETSEPRGFVVRFACIRLLHESVHRIPRSTSVTIAKRPSILRRDGAGL